VSIRLSEKHGVNPMLASCFLCGEDTGEIALLGKMKGDAAAPHRGVITKEPCDQCKGYMEQGVILISTRDGESGDSPYRTGGWCVVREEAIRRMPIDEASIAQLLESRVGFLEDTVWDHFGFPRGEQMDEGVLPS